MLDLALNLDILLEWMILTLSVVFIFIGLSGLIIKKWFLKEINFFGPKSSKLEDLIQWFLLWSGIIALIFGSMGAILVIFLGEKLVKSDVLQTALSFVSFYMLFFGVFLIAYHKKIFVKPKIRR
jgi:glucan phosphoethanolaminetransferase (alkaline phosphatase superfamily)